MIRPTVLIGLTIALWLSAFPLVTATAQTVLPSVGSSETTEKKTPPSPNDVKELLRLLGDERIVEWLKTNANKALEGVDADSMRGRPFREQMLIVIERTRERAQLLQSVGIHFPMAPRILTNRWREELSGAQTVRSLTYIIIFLIIGAGLEWLYRQYTAGRLLRIELTKPENLNEQVLSALARAVLIFGGLIVFTVGSIGAFLSFTWPAFVEIIVINFLIAVIVIRSILTVSKFVLAPRVPELRLAPLPNRYAKQTSFYVAIVVSTFAILLTAADTFTRLAARGAMSDRVEAAAFSVSIIAGLICIGTALLAVWRMSMSVTDAAELTGDDARALVRRSVFWRRYLTVVAIIAFLFWVIAAGEMMWTVLIAGLLPPTLALVYRWIDHFFDQAEAFLQSSGAEEPDQEELEQDEGETEAEDESEDDEDEPDFRRYDTYRIMVQRVARFVLILGAILALLPAWGTGFFVLADSSTLAGRLFSIAIDLLVALLIADLIWTWAKTAIDRRLANYKPPEGGEAPGPEARMATLLPLLRMMLLITLVIMVSLSALSSMGVNIAPLLAGAGVVGVAIGFGTQALVRDIVSGIFFLIDDAFRVGEYIEIGNLRGTVESMSIRSLRVRHHRGAVHTIPFGELSSLTNYSRDWVIMKMEFRVAFDTDMKLVKKLLKKIGAEMMEDPLYKDSFIEPLKSQGVRRMEEFNMVVGVKFMSKPGEQWVIRREAYHKIVATFEANGIRLAERNVKVEVVSDKALTEEEHEAVVGAAQEAAEGPPGPAAPIKDEP